MGRQGGFAREQTVGYICIYHVLGILRQNGYIKTCFSGSLI